MNKIPQISKLGSKLLAIKLSDTTNKTSEYKRAIFYSLSEMGGVYIKFLQIMATNSNFMKGWSGPRELSVFENVKIEPLNIYDYVDASAFSYLESTAFASGSFAQVYKGQLKTGEVVAIKVLRPSATQNLNNDLKTIKNLARVIPRFLPSTIIDFKSLAAEFVKTTKAEIDYNREIANIEYFYNYYQHNPNIVIPKVYKNLSNSHAIVQDFIAGPTLAEVMVGSSDKNPIDITKELVGSDLQTQLTIFGTELLNLAFFADYFFGDPHPGNIKLLPNNKVGIIDFGIVVDPPSSRRALYDYMYEYLRVLNGYSHIDRVIKSAFYFCCPDLALVLQNHSLDTNSLLEQVAVAVDSKLVAMRAEATVKDVFAKGQLFKLFYQILDKNGALTFQISETELMMLKSMQVFLSSMNRLGDSIDASFYFYALRDGIAGAVKAVNDRGGLSADYPLSSRYSEAEGYTVIADILASLANKDQFIFNAISSSI